MSTPPRSSVPIARFRAGDLWLGVAAAAIESIGPPRPDVPHVAAALGLDCAPGPAARTLRVMASPEPLEIMVDGPIYIEELGREQLLPTAASLRRPWLQPVIGFARFDEVVVLLLDLSNLDCELSKPKGGQPDASR